MPRTGLKIAEKLEGERLYTDVARVEFERSLVEPVFYVPREVYLVKGAAPAVGWVNRYGDYYLSRVLDKSLTPEQCWDASYKQETRPVNECVAQFLELARTPDSKHEAFLKFAEEWGVLGIWPRIYVDDNDNYAWRYRESIAMWRRFARQYYALYRVGAKLVQGQLAKREDWKSAVDQRSLHYYRVDGEAFQTDRGSTTQGTREGGIRPPATCQHAPRSGLGRTGHPAGPTQHGVPESAVGPRLHHKAGSSVGINGTSDWHPDHRQSGVGRRICWQRTEPGKSLRCHRIGAIPSQHSLQCADPTTRRNPGFGGRIPSVCPVRKRLSARP